MCDEGTMTKVAESRPIKKSRQADEGAEAATHVRNASRVTAAQKIIRSSSGWTGDDLEEIIDVVSATLRPAGARPAPRF